jgi:hypothetical protein
MPNKTPVAATEPNNTASGLTTKRIILILGALVIVCAAVIVAIMLLRSTSDISAEQSPLGNLVIDESNIDAIGAEIEEKVAKGMFETHMNTTWTFPDGESASSNAVMGNAASNNYPFYFTVTLSDTGEIVYTSSLLPVGTVIKEIVLNKDLDKGVYPAVVGINMVDENGEAVENNMGINISVIIEH